MTFAQPVFLFLGLGALALLGWAYARAARARRRALAAFAAPGLLAKLTRGLSRGRRRLRTGLVAAAVACLFIALARPQAGYRWEETHRRGIDILIALDTSKSMLANDASPTRLERAKLGILDFIEHIRGDRVGLIPFAGEAFVSCPMTLDHDAFRQSLASVDTDIVPLGGTDIAAALREAHAAFKDDAAHKILLLITDGEDLEGDAIAEAERAAESGMTVYTVGVGTAAGQQIPVRDANGHTSLLRGADGQVVTSRLDEAALGRIASLTGGAYESLGRRAEGLMQIYDRYLDIVPKDELSQRRHKVPLEQFVWPLLMAGILLLLEFLTSDRRRLIGASARWAPSPGPGLRPLWVPVKASAVVLILIASALFAATTAWASPDDPRTQYNEGVADYREGRYDEAAAAFHRALSSEDLSLHNRAWYGLGNVMYRQGERLVQTDPASAMKTWEKALEQYQGALQLDPNDADARFNHDFVARKLEELKKRQEAKKKQSKDQQSKDQQSKDQQSKDQQSKDQQSKDQQSKDQQSKDQQSKDQQSKDQQSKDQQSKDQQSKDQQSKDQQSKDQQSKGQQSKGQQSKGQQSKDQQAKDQQPKDQESKGQQAKDQQSKDEQSKDKHAKEQQSKDQQSKDQQSKDEQSNDEQSNDEQSNDEQSNDEQSKDKQAKADESEGKPRPTVARTGEAKPEAPDGQARPRAGNAAERAADDRKRAAPGRMNREEARALLDALEDEAGELLLARPRGAPSHRPARNRKDW